MGNSFRETIPLTLALSGQIFPEQDSATYVFPKQENTDWKPETKDTGRTLLDSLGIEYPHGCLSFWLTPGGVCYSYCKRLTGRAGSDTAVAILYSTISATKGRLLKEKFVEILTYVTGLAEEKKSQSDIDDKRINEWLISVQECFEGGHHCKRNPDQAASASAASEQSNPIHAMYEYNNDDELDKIVRLFPFHAVAQEKEYIHFVCPALRKGAQEETKVERLNVRLQERYFFKKPLPGGVHLKEDKDYVAEDEEFRLVYEFSRAGYEPATTGPLTVNKSSSKYFLVDKSTHTIIVKPYDEETMGLTFDKKVKISVIDEESGDPISDWMCSILGEKGRDEIQSIDEDGYIKIPKGKYKLKIFDKNKNYSEASRDIDTDDILQSGVVEVSMKPRYSEYELRLVPAWRKTKEEIKTTVSVKKGGDADAYLGRHSQRSKTPFYISATHPVVAMVLVGLLMAALGFGVEKFISEYGSEEPSNPQVQDTAAVSKIESTDAPEQPSLVKDQREDEEDRLEKLDVAYLNENSTWKRIDIKSKKYLYFFDTVVPNRRDWDNGLLSEYSDVTNKAWRRLVSDWETAKNPDNSDKKRWNVFNDKNSEIESMIKKDSTINWGKFVTDAHPLPKQQSHEGGSGSGPNAKPETSDEKLLEI